MRYSVSSRIADHPLSCDSQSIRAAKGGQSLASSMMRIDKRSFAQRLRQIPRGRSPWARRWPPWVSPEKRVEREYDKHDRAAGYAEYHAFCRSRFRRELGDSTTPLVTNGRERLRLMSAAEAVALRERIERDYASDHLKAKSQHLTVYAIDDEAFVREILERILTPEVDARAARFFGSEYFVYWTLVSRASPVPSLGFNSFRWHCDKGPRAHLKLIAYLSANADHGGGSEWLDLETTKGLAREGYVFAPVKTRVSDISGPAARAGIDTEPWFPDLEAGESVLFQPSNVLHRGVVPETGVRVAVTACLLPSPIPWREALDRGLRVPLDAGEKWSPDASEFRAALT